MVTLRSAALRAALLAVLSLVRPANGIGCHQLYAAQYCCASPAIDTNTQQAVGCRRDNTVDMLCFALDGVVCDGTLYLEYTNSTDADDPVDATSCNDRVYTSSDTIFNRSQPCYFIDPNNKHDFHTALALSVFFGPLGLDRFYLGYHGYGFAKLCTGGFFTLGWLADIILIALQIVKPADGTQYFMPHYGPRSYGLFQKADEEKYEDFSCE